MEPFIESNSTDSFRTFPAAQVKQSYFCPICHRERYEPHCHACKISLLEPWRYGVVIRS